MSEPGDATRPVDTLSAPERRKGQPVLAWVVIVAGVGFALWYRADRPVEYEPGAGEQAAYLVMQMQARYMVGAVGLVGNGDRLYAQAQSLDTGPIGQRLRFITLAGELKGPEEALKQLHLLGDKLEQEKLKSKGIQPSPTEKSLLGILDRLYDDYAHGHLEAPSVSSRERQELQEQLGWSGELALAPASGPDASLREAVLAAARRTTFVILGTFAVLGLLGFAGLFGLIVLLVLLFSGQIPHGVRAGAGHAAVYAETFALWLLLFFAISFAVGRWLPRTGSFLLLSAGLELVSLTALWWPVLRGVPWQQVRQEIGLYAGRRPLLEPFAGVANYAMTLPFLALGVATMLVLILYQRLWAGDAGAANDFSPSNLPSHPIIPYLVSTDWWGRLQVLLLASVIAPVVEETMFRGVLYRHLRDASSRFGYPLSVGLSTLAVSFIFAVVHPQGLIAVPALMGIAFGLTLVREWRGSLVPGMVTHGINNAVVLCVTIAALSN